jgi:hypothetical protein
MTPATAMIKMNQKCQNIRSTTKHEITSDLEDETVTLPAWEQKLTWFTPWLLSKGSCKNMWQADFLYDQEKEIWCVMVCYSYD